MIPPMRLTLLCALVISAALLASCGGSGTPNSDGTGDTPQNTDTGTDTGDGTGTNTDTPNTGPDVALLISNGHSPLLPNYMAPVAGPQLENAILGAGFTVETTYFTDDGASYAAFVAKLQQIRDDWIAGKTGATKVVIVGHSHGCVRSHAATRAVTDCPVELLVDLDGSSVGWTALTHGPENAAIEGAPEGAYNLGVQLTCLTVPSAGGPHDLEDVVFPHVTKCYEVRSGDVVLDPQNLGQFIQYDERWNARTDGSTTDLTCVFSNTLHAEVATAGGTTLAGVQAWILSELGTP